jgi:hypothetical protein
MRAPRPLRVAVNEQGRRIGETHHNALIPDAVVDQMRGRHEDDGIGYREIAREFGLKLPAVSKICTYQRRAQTAERWKTIRAGSDPISRERAGGGDHPRNPPGPDRNATNRCDDTRNPPALPYKGK